MCVSRQSDEEKSSDLSAAVRTFEMNRGVRVLFGCGSFNFLDVLVVVVALEIVAVFVHKRRIAVDNSALVAGKIGDLAVTLLAHEGTPLLFVLPRETQGATNLLVSDGTTGGSKMSLTDKPGSSLQFVTAICTIFNRGVGVGI